MRYFVVSDVHSFFSVMKEALVKKGFDEEKDTLIIDGDLFDRGNESLKMLEYVQNLPHKILIKGNHEYLFEQLVDSIKKGKRVGRHHYSNGTIQTLMHLSGIIDEDSSALKESLLLANLDPAYDFDIKKAMGDAIKSKKVEELLNLIKEEFIDYYELGDYIITHCWIPTDYDGPFSSYDLVGHCQDAPYWKDEKAKTEYGKLDKEVPPEAIVYKKISYDPDWKNASRSRWKEATWGCPLEFMELKLTPPGKTIICGHWQTLDFHYRFENGNLSDDTYFGENVIAIDACAASSQQVNVLVFEDDKLAL